MNTYRFKTVLLIDDNTIDNFINTKLITKAGFSEKVIEKTSAISALDFLREIKNEEEVPDVILLDIMMPVMDGFEFLEQYDKMPADVKSKSRVVMLSSTESFKDLNRANSNPYVYKFLNKPLTEAVLAAIR
ncbi:MAG: response regulator [Bacteroidota bacterium]|nr:response regulator [Bacteroidota bacterium]